MTADRITATFLYDNTSGVYEGRVNGGKVFYFGGRKDAPMPQQLANALEALRLETMRSAKAVYERKIAEGAMTLDEVLEKVKDFEERGGRIQIVGRQKREYTPLSLEDLEL